MKSIWSFWAVLLACILMSMPALAQSANPTDEDVAEHVKNDKVLTCDDVRDCQEKQVIRWHNNWVQCLVPTVKQIRLENGTYKAVDGPNFNWKRGEKCECPEGYTMSRAHRIQTVTGKDGTVHKTAFISGVCLPLDVEPNAVIIADALNKQREFIAQVNTDLARHKDDVLAWFNDLSGEVYYNQEDIAKLSGRVDALEAFMNGSCQTSRPGSWKFYVCNRVEQLAAQVYEDIKKLKRRQKEMAVRAVFELSHYAGGRDLVGGGVGGAWYPALSERVRWELGGRLTLTHGQDMTEYDGDSAAAVMGTVYTGPSFLATEDGQVQVHARAMVQQAYRIDGFEAMSGGVGPELGVSFCPSSEADAPLSFCVQPFLNLGYGRSGYPEKADPAANVPNHYREETGWRAGGGITLGGQF
ncbi:hypothetical protein GF391_04480 [Candidatus Uhrbacteria bacterium]|nr:hypothetical protein [Candidatus Uhrbacteria bacterium]